MMSAALISIDGNAPKRGTSGVYQIYNTLTNDRYIGSAKCFRIRWLNHLWTLRDNSSHCIHLQFAWNKYGEGAFRFEIVERVPNDKTKLFSREQFYLDSLQPEYNISTTASGGAWGQNEPKVKLRKPKSEETKRRMSAGVKRSYELNPELRQMRIDNFQAVRDSDPTHNRGPRNGMYGVSLDRLAMISPEAERRRVEIVKQAHRDGRMKYRAPKPVEQLSPTGELIRCWPSLKDAAEAVGCGSGNITNACRGRSKTCAGFQWRYAT